MENTSGQGATAAVPSEVDRWNWGAFFLNWIWGIGNNTFIALLMFVPFVNLVMPFVLGAKGSGWAWQNKRWESVEHFRKTQRRWSLAGAAVLVALIVLFVAISFGALALMKSSGAYALGVERLERSPAAIRALGEPIETGYPMGNIEASGTSGRAEFSFSAEGPKANGTVYLDAFKEMGRWKIDRIELAVDGRGERIDLSR